MQFFLGMHLLLIIGNGSSNFVNNVSFVVCVNDVQQNSHMEKNVKRTNLKVLKSWTCINTLPPH